MRDFARSIVRWQRQRGRRGMPWQGVRDPYRVWLSEIMLQQTRVDAVTGYYLRFLARFPDVGALAQASQHEVLQLWSGLGYYARARNLHAAARELVAARAGRFPRSAVELVALPGLGRSTSRTGRPRCPPAAYWWNDGRRAGSGVDSGPFRKRTAGTRARAAV